MFGFKERWWASHGQVGACGGQSNMVNFRAATEKPGIISYMDGPVFAYQ